MTKSIILYTTILITSLSAILMIGCQQQDESSLPASPTLAIRNIQICSDVSDDGDYTVQFGATFGREDVAYVYFDAYGFTNKVVNEKFEVWATFSEVEIFDPNGDRLAHLVDMGGYHTTDSDEPPDSIWFEVHYTFKKDDPVGQYTVRFTVKDELSGGIGTGSATFTLE